MIEHVEIDPPNLGQVGQKNTTPANFQASQLRNDESPKELHLSFCIPFSSFLSMPCSLEHRSPQVVAHAENQSKLSSRSREKSHTRFRPDVTVFPIAVTKVSPNFLLSQAMIYFCRMKCAGVVFEFHLLQPLPHGIAVLSLLVGLSSSIKVNFL